MKVNKKKAATAGFFIATFIGSVMLFTAIFKDLGNFGDRLENDYDYL